MVSSVTKQIEDNLFMTRKEDGMYFHTAQALKYSRNGAHFYDGAYVTRLNSKHVIIVRDYSPELLEEFENAPTLFQYKMGR